MPLQFTSPHDQPLGQILSLLQRSYAALVEAEAGCWGRVAPMWAEFDREVFAHPDTIGSCVFLSWADDVLVGFGSYDPRQKPAFGIVGHNCILPEFRGRGHGAAQVREILRRLRELGIRKAQVTTGAHPFFLPARRAYAACGFRETGRRPWDVDPAQSVIDYEADLG